MSKPVLGLFGRMRETLRERKKQTRARVWRTSDKRCLYCDRRDPHEHQRVLVKSLDKLRDVAPQPLEIVQVLPFGSFVQATTDGGTETVPLTRAFRRPAVLDERRKAKPKLRGLLNLPKRCPGCGAPHSVDAKRCVDPDCGARLPSMASVRADWNSERGARFAELPSMESLREHREIPATVGSGRAG
jgi:hypothetical protein